MRIFNNETLIKGIEYIKSLASVTTDRDISTDINIMLGELQKVEILINNPHINKVKVNCDMWEECLVIMDDIISEYDLDYEVTENDNQYNEIVDVYVIRKGGVL